MWKSAGRAPSLRVFTLAFALQLRKKHGKTTVRVKQTSVRLIKTSVRVILIAYVMTTPGWRRIGLPYILESNPHPFYSFRVLKNQMRITIACGLDSRLRAGFWKNDGATVRAIRTIQ
jgi:hypothetical protein